MQKSFLYYFCRGKGHEVGGDGSRILSVGGKDDDGLVGTVAVDVGIARSDVADLSIVVGIYVRADNLDVEGNGAI